MQGKIALEEHFAIDETLGDSRLPIFSHVWDDMQARLMAFDSNVLKRMDAYGVEIMIVSLNAPAVQAIADPAKAVEVARKANDALASLIAQRPDRYRGFAALPLQDPQAACEEMSRCMKMPGFVGALVNGYSTAPDGAPLYYDLPQYEAFWSLTEELEAPFYLHPRNSVESALINYEGHRWMLGAAWGFAQETSVHALRLMGSGLFDRHPRLQMILGHLGENLPYGLWRIDNCNAWRRTPGEYVHHAARPIADYFRDNVWLTTSGNFCTRTLQAAISITGADRIMFSADWPFEDLKQAADWFDTAAIPEPDRIKIGRTNACNLFHLEG
ncbi:MAG: amidohydrolase [Hyphomicrobiales bacterium]|nr:amidohydrolase [Hyphomicrobiales bacterium]